MVRRVVIGCISDYSADFAAGAERQVADDRGVRNACAGIRATKPSQRRKQHGKHCEGAGNLSGAVRG